MNAELWSRLCAFSLDAGGAEFSFTRRLARENGWSTGYATRVGDEYKRFLYLVAEAGHPVTPSDEVDQAWHLHLCYTRSYWDELCGKVIGKPIHHGPTRGGRAEGEKFTDWYAKTLAAYEAHFGEVPPEDIWPRSEVRFARQDYRRVDVSKVVMVPRRGLRWVAGAGVAGVVLAGCAEGVSGKIGFWSLFVAGIVLTIVVRAAGNRGGRRGGQRGGGTGCGTGDGSSGSDSWGDSDGGSSGCGGSGCGGGGCGGGD